MKKFAEVLVNIGNILWGTVYVMAGASLLLGSVVYLSRHVTCLNLFDKVCFVY